MMLSKENRQNLPEEVDDRTKTEKERTAKGRA